MMAFRNIFRLDSNHKKIIEELLELLMCYKFSRTLIAIRSMSLANSLLNLLWFRVLCRLLLLTIIHLPFSGCTFFSRVQFSFHAWCSTKYFFFKKYVTNVDMMWLSLTPHIHSLSISILARFQPKLTRMIFISKCFEMSDLITLTIHICASNFLLFWDVTSMWFWCLSEAIESSLYCLVAID